MGVKMRLILLFVLLVATYSCKELNQCESSAKVIYFIGTGECEYYIEIDSVLYEPTNIEAWSNVLTFQEEQLVNLNFFLTGEISNCGLMERLEITCLTRRDEL